MAKKWLLVIPVLATLLLLLATSLDFDSVFSRNFLSNGPCPTNNSVNWVITSGRLNLVQTTALESIFLHNPEACLNIYMKEDMEDAVEVLDQVKRLQNDGFLIFILRYNFRALVAQTLTGIEGVPTRIVQQFFQRFPTYEQGEYWTYSHESNFVRLLVLLQHGGIYLDTDIVLVKSLQAKSFRNSIAYEMEDGGRLNNNVLIFDPNHWFLFTCLQEMFSNYSPSVYTANGPQLITRVFNSLTDKRDVTVLPADTFQPVNWVGVSRIIFTQPSDQSESVEYQEIIEKSAVGVHLNNRLTRNFEIRKGTLAHNILAGNCLYCDGLTSVEKERK